MQQQCKGSYCIIIVELDTYLTKQGNSEIMQTNRDSDVG